MGGVDGQGGVIGGERAQRLRRQVGSRSARGLEASQQGIGRLGAVEVGTAVTHGHEGVGQLALEILGSATEGPEQPARSWLARGRVGHVCGEMGFGPALGLRLDGQVGPVIPAGRHGKQVDVFGCLNMQALQQLQQALEQPGR